MQHEEELKKLFDDLTWKVGRNSGVITFKDFKKAIDQKMDEAYSHGKKEGVITTTATLSRHYPY